MRRSTAHTFLNKKFGKLLTTKLCFYKFFRSCGKIEKIPYLKCICECGKEKWIALSSLKTNRTKSCGCLSYLISRDNANWRGYGEISLYYFNRLKKNSKQRGISFRLDIKTIWNKFLKQRKKCALSGLDLRFSNNHSDVDSTASLDRIDSNKGYIDGNVQWVHKDINKIKGNFNEEKFINYCKLISKNNK